MLFVVVLALSLAWSFGTVCEGSQEQGVTGGRHSKVRCALTECNASGRLASPSAGKVDWWG